MIISGVKSSWTALYSAANGSADVAHYGHSMGELLVDHTTALSAVCLASLVLGLPLSVNMLWHLRVATNAAGRGVLRDTITFSECSVPFITTLHKQEGPSG